MVGLSLESAVTESYWFNKWKYLDIKHRVKKLLCILHDKYLRDLRFSILKLRN